MRILLASDHYPPFIGGAHRQTQLLGRELHARGHQVAVTTGWHPGLPAQEDDHGVPVYRFRQLRTWGEHQATQLQQRHQPPFPDPLEAAELRKLVDKFQPDVIHTYGWISYSVAAALTKRDIPLLLSARDYGYSCATRSLVYRGVEPCSGPAFWKCLTCAQTLYGIGKGVTAVLGVAGGGELLRRKVTGIHSISTYVQEIVRRDFLGEDENKPGQGAHEGAPWPIEAIIPSFREDDEEAESDDAAIHEYLAQLPEEPYILFVGALRREFETGGQFLMTSHSAEAIRRFSDENTIVLTRASHLEPPQVRW